MTLSEKIIIDLEEARQKYVKEVEKEEITTAKTALSRDFKLLQFDPEVVTEKREIEQPPGGLSEEGPNRIEEAAPPEPALQAEAPEIPPTRLDGPTRADIPQADVSSGPLDGPTRVDAKVFPDENRMPEPFPRRVGSLIVLRGESSGREIELDKDEFTIGRGPDCDLVLADITCSRLHARIRRQGGSYLLIDNNSGNGTLLNNSFIHQSVLKEGDRVSVGRTILQYTGSRPTPNSGSGPHPTDLPVTCPNAPADSSPDGLLARLLETRRRQFAVLFILGGLLGLIIVVAVLSSLVKRNRSEVMALEQRREKNLKIRKRLEHNLEMARELVKVRDWQQAGVYTQLALKLDPQNRLARDYQTSIRREQVCSRALTAARTYLGQRSYDSALAAISTVGPDSIYYDEAVRLKGEIDDQLKTNALRDTLAHLEANTAEDPKPRHRRVARRTRKPARPRPDDKISELYTKGEIDQAIAQADTSGDKERVQSLRRFKLLYQQGVNLSKDQSKPTRSLKFLNPAFDLDRDLSGSGGHFHQELTQRLYKVHFVAAVDAFSRQRYPDSYLHLNEARRFRPDCPLIHKRLKQLERVAKRTYEEAYVIKSNYPEGAMKKLRLVMQIVPPDHLYYAKAQRLLKKIQGLGVATPVPDNGF